MSLDTACEKPMTAAMSDIRPAWDWFVGAGEQFDILDRGNEPVLDLLAL